MSLTTKQLSAAQPKIGEVVRELWQVMNLSQEKFAAELGLSFPRIDPWDNGHTVLFPLALKQIEMQQFSDRGEALRTQSISKDPTKS